MKEIIKQYNDNNKGYNITGIKKLPVGRINHLRENAPKSLNELYKRCSDAKWDSWYDILKTYEPKEIIGLQGSSMAYSVVLIASNGDTLWITKDNNYLVEVV